jgi:hypothetical protein
MKARRAHPMHELRGFCVYFDRWDRSWSWREDPCSRLACDPEDVRAGHGFATRRAAYDDVREELSRRRLRQLAAALAAPSDVPVAGGASEPHA